MLKINSKGENFKNQKETFFFLKLRKTDKVKAQHRRYGIGIVGLPKEDNQSSGPKYFF